MEPELAGGAGGEGGDSGVDPSGGRADGAPEAGAASLGDAGAESGSDAGTGNGGHAGTPGAGNGGHGGADPASSGTAGRPDAAGGAPVVEPAAGAGGDTPAPPCPASAQPPRLLAPLSTALVTSRRPTLEFELGDDCGALTLEVCADRDCTEIRSSVSLAAGAIGARPDTDLPAGVSFWRVRSGDVASHVWQFTAGKDTLVDTWWGTIPDFNGDGYADVAVGTRSDVVYVYYGSPDGLVADSPTIIDNPEKDGSLFGAQLASAGDVNGDGFADLLVASAAMPAGGEGSRVYLHLGGASGVTLDPSQELEASSYVHDDDAFLPINSAIRGGADLNSDGYSDFILTEPSAIPESTGLFWPHFGGSKEVVIGRRVYPADYAAWFGSSLSICDVDGDRHSDVIIGSPIVHEDVVRSDDLKALQAVVYRGTGSDLRPEQRLLLTHGFGYGVACLDATGDGYPDLITSSPEHNGIGYYAGDVRFFRNDKGVIEDAGTSLPDQPTFNYSESGSRISIAGDMNGDGMAEIAVRDLSEVRIVFRATSSAAGDAVRVTGNWEYEPSDFTGGDVDGDGLSDLILSEIDLGITVYRGSQRSRIVSPSRDNIPAPAGVVGFANALSAGL